MEVCRWEYVRGWKSEDEDEDGGVFWRGGWESWGRDLMEQGGDGGSEGRVFGVVFGYEGGDVGGGGGGKEMRGTGKEGWGDGG